MRYLLVRGDRRDYSTAVFFIGDIRFMSEWKMYLYYLYHTSSEGKKINDII